MVLFKNERHENRSALCSSHDAMENEIVREMRSVRRPLRRAVKTSFTAFTTLNIAYAALKDFKDVNGAVISHPTPFTVTTITATEHQHFQIQHSR